MSNIAETALGPQQPTGGSIERDELEPYRPRRSPEARGSPRIRGRLWRVIGEELCASQRVEWDRWPERGYTFSYTTDASGRAHRTMRVTQTRDLSRPGVVRFACGGPLHGVGKHWYQLERDA